VSEADRLITHRDRDDQAVYHHNSDYWEDPLVVDRSVVADPLAVVDPLVVADRSVVVDPLAEDPLVVDRLVEQA
jgi:hypothetical protein